MFQCTALVARKDEAALSGAHHRACQVALADRMTPARIELHGRVLEPLFDRDHRLAGEPVFASPVLAEPYQIERGLHRREHAVELLLAVAMSVHEPGKIARSERRLVVRDRIERESRLGED